jgi:hypothetical protein
MTKTYKTAEGITRCLSDRLALGISTRETELGTVRQQWEGRRHHSDKKVKMAVRECQRTRGPDLYKEVPELVLQTGRIYQGLQGISFKNKDAAAEQTSFT